MLAHGDSCLFKRLNTYFMLQIFSLKCCFKEKSSTAVKKMKFITVSLYKNLMFLMHSILYNKMWQMPFKPI